MLVFLSHAGADALPAQELARGLRQAGVDVWLDTERLQPGAWMPQIEAALEQSHAFLVYIGATGILNWVDMETRAAIDRKVKSPAFPLIPVLGPGAPKPERLPLFLRQQQALSFHDWPPTPEQLRALAASLGQPATQPIAVLPPDASPFAGLHPFQPEDALLFCGRDGEIAELLDRTRTRPIVGVVGASGSGKSSLVRAGLIPAVVRGRLGSGAGAWRFALIRPGGDPFRELAESLPQLAPDLTPKQRFDFIEGLAPRLAANPENLRSAIAALVPDQVSTLLVIDQFEELFTLTPDQTLRKTYVESLVKTAQLATNRPVHIVFTVRADFLGHCMEYAGLLAAHQLLYRPEAAQLQKIIERPLALIDARIEPALLKQLLEDAGEEPGNLPLLEFALYQLWNRRDGRQLTLSSYDNIERLAGAIASQANDTLNALPPEQQRIALPALARLVRLASAGEQGADSRQRIPLPSLDQQVRAVYEAFAQARLLVLSEQYVEFAHEALLKSWTPLRKYIEDDRSFLLWRQTLNLLRVQWDSSGRNPDSLLPGSQLGTAANNLKSRPTDFLPAERKYVEESLRAHRRSRRLVVAAVLAPVVIAAVSGSYWLYTRSDAYQVRTAIARAPLREALMSSRSDDDPYIIAIQDWICTLTARGDHPSETLGSLNGYEQCFVITGAAAERGLGRMTSSPLPGIGPLLKDVASYQLGGGAQFVCLSNLQLNETEKQLVSDAARSYTGAAAGDSFEKTRDSIEVLQALVNLGERTTIHDRAAGILRQLGNSDANQRPQLTAYLANRLGPALAAESIDEFRKLFPNPNPYYGGVVEAAFGKVAARSAGAKQLHALLAALPRRLLYDSDLGGFLLARLVQERESKFAMEECKRLLQGNPPPLVTASLFSPVADALAQAGQHSEADQLAEAALVAASAIDQEESRSRALSRVAITFARLHKLPKARSIADRCARSLDRLRALTAIVAEGSGLPLPDSFASKPACCQALKK